MSKIGRPKYPEGTEVTRLKNGKPHAYIYVKSSDPVARLAFNHAHEAWEKLTDDVVSVRKDYYTYIKHKGDFPKNKYVYHIDNDYTNCNIENIYLGVSRTSTNSSFNTVTAYNEGYETYACRSDRDLIKVMIWVSINDPAAQLAAAHSTCNYIQRRKDVLIVRKDYYVYIKHRGDFPHEKRLLHLDGDSKNCELNNLMLVTKSELVTISRLFKGLRDPHLIETLLALKRAGVPFKSLRGHLIK